MSTKKSVGSLIQSPTYTMIQVWTTEMHLFFSVSFRFSLTRTHRLDQFKHNFIAFERYRNVLAFLGPRDSYPFKELPRLQFVSISMLIFRGHRL